MKELGMQRKNLKNDLKRLQYKQVLGNFSEGQGFADKRKRKALNRYRKLQRRRTQNDISDNQDNDAEGGTHNAEDLQTGTLIQENEKRLESQQESVQSASDVGSKKRLQDPKKHRFSKAQREYEARRSQKQQLAQARREEQAKREAAMEGYKKKKLQRNKLFSKKTRRGQPIMKHRIDFLLEKLKAEGE